VRRGLAVLLLALSLPALPGRAEILPVDLELVLALDASGSVDDAEWALQLQGVAAAFRDPAVQAAIGRQPLGRIAVALVVWAEGNRPKDISPWFLVADAAGAEAFAQTVERFPRRIENGGTGIGKALYFAGNQILHNAYDGGRQVVDISGDGSETPPSEWTLSIRGARAYADAHGIVVNGLAILSDDPGLKAYFQREVITGPDSFVIAVADYTAYAEAMRRKLLREIQTEPRLSSLP
jgi:hypothetical protein